MHWFSYMTWVATVWWSACTTIYFWESVSPYWFSLLVSLTSSSTTTSSTSSSTNTGWFRLSNYATIFPSKWFSIIWPTFLSMPAGQLGFLDYQSINQVLWTQVVSSLIRNGWLSAATVCAMSFGCLILVGGFLVFFLSVPRGLSSLTRNGWLSATTACIKKRKHLFFTKIIHTWGSIKVVERSCVLLHTRHARSVGFFWQKGRSTTELREYFESPQCPEVQG
jgi:hypothetical protein